MCKFTNLLFILVSLMHLAVARPPSPARTDLLDFLYNDYNDYGYQEEEIHYDQRQKGEENLQLRLNGFLIGVPNHDESHWLELLAEDYLNYALLLDEKSKKEPLQQQEQEQQSQNQPQVSEQQVINIPAPKRDLESRQHATEDISSAPRTKSHVLQLLQMLRRYHPTN